MVTSHNPTAPATSPNATPAVARTAPPIPLVHPTLSAPPSSATRPASSEAEIRDYANHLFVQRGSVHGHDYDDWLEAEACLNANIPKESSRTRMHHHTQITERVGLPLVKHGGS